MYKKEDVIKNLNADNYYIDIRTLENFISEWQIDPIYESKDGVVFFDDVAIQKIKKCISLKSQGFEKEQICYKIHKIVLPPPKETPFEEEKQSEQEENSECENNIIPIEQSDVENKNESEIPQMRNVTLDVTNQTLQMLAEAVANKITEDITKHIDTSQLAEKLVKTGEYKKDNEILASQVAQLLEDNKRLAKRIENLEHKSKSFWHRLFH